MRYLQTLVAALALATIATPGVSPAQETADEINQAQQVIFMGDHLQQLVEGQTVVYRFTRRASGEPDQHDEVRMTVDKVRDDSRRNLSFQFLSGADQIDFPTAVGYRGNPVAIQFLERDIRDMAQATGTPTAYFRNRVRNAFKQPQIEQTRLTVDEATVDALEISVTPFRDDPNLAQTAGYAGKQYRFAYSEQIPGHLISIQTQMTDGNDAFLEEQLRYSGVTDTDTSADAAGQ
ncbi:MAG: hypothetical protein WBM40_19825 [Thiohalocapsa sp.]